MTSPFNVGTPNKFISLSSAAPEPLRGHDGDLKFLSIFALFRRRWKLVFTVAFITILIALPLILGKEVTYSGQARVLYIQSKTFDLAQPRQDIISDKEELEVETQIQRLWSRDMALAVIERFNLDEREEFNPAPEEAGPLGALEDAVRGFLLSQFSSDELEEEDAAADDTNTILLNYYGALSISRQEDIDVVTISFRSEDPELAAAIPNAIAEIDQTRSDERWQAEVKGATEWLDSQIAAAKDQLESTRALLAEMRYRSQLTLENATIDNRDRIRAIQEELDQIARERFDLREPLNAISATNGSPETMVLADEPPTVSNLRKDLQKKQQELDGLLSTFGERYDGIASRRASIEALRSELSGELARYGKSLEARDADLDARARDLEREFSELRTMLETQRLAVPDLGLLIKTSVDQAEAVSKLELHRETLVAQSHISPMRIDILSPATVPMAPSGKSRKSLLLGAAFAGLLLGLTAAAIREMRDHTVRSHEELSYLDQFVPVGFLPKLRRQEKKNLPETIRSRARSPVTEWLSDTVFMIECADDGTFPSSLLVVGTEEAGNRVSEWLAMELIATGRQVLLVDVVAGHHGHGAGRQANADGGQLSRQILHNPETGLARLVLDENFFRDAQTRQSFDDLLFHAHAEGYVTLVDGPSLHDGVAIRIAQHVARTLLVMRWGRTQRPEAELLAGLLGKARIKKVFSLITDVNFRRHRLYGFTDRISLAARGRQKVVR
ncbi:GumC family protein [Tropicimonas isoalkanivorans]|uniref:Uncharacterized protein involved in exopolysaccharide biosynthesis n=1 Tax=Tropicimonas isoalkanivorans TaxID=441112 RepID=A0A1I1LKD3_9RHOB|nr:exopolysaccharide transport family protein [Tropicimonas isoalkanivorans]SFC73657.1 Uncharacterized protein involved in exopolysaccharide biosynthesis [Tropicimonas isoalkanivorans]